MDSKYAAEARIPFRPLSYAEKDLAEPKEILVDYENNKIYICDINGEIHDITIDITTSISSNIVEAIEKDPTIVTGVEITLPNGDIVTIEAAIINALTEIESIKNTIKGMLPLAGGTMTGPIVLHGDPIEKMHATPKQYVDTSVQGAIDSFANTLITGEW